MAQRLTIAAALLALAVPAWSGPERITAGDRDCLRPALSGDGRYVVFETEARLTADDNDRRSDVYLMDRRDGRLERVEGPEADRRNAGPSINRDGSLIAFHSITMTKLARNETPVGDIVVVHQKSKRRYFLPTGKADNDGQSLFPTLSPDGRYIVFTSNASRLALSREIPVRAVFLFDRNRWSTSLVSRSSKGEPSNRPSSAPRMSADARYVAFLSAATNLVAGDSPDALTQRLYHLDRIAGRLVRVDEFDRGFDPKEWWVGRFDMDGKGASIVFEARRRMEGDASDLSRSDLFAYHTATRQVTLLTTGIFAQAAFAPAISRDGRYVAFRFSGVSGARTEEGAAGLVVYDRQADVWRRAVSGACSNPVFSGDGKEIAYEAVEEIERAGRKQSVRNIFVVANPFDEESDVARD